jgi:hypothetical protein
MAPAPVALEESAVATDGAVGVAPARLRQPAGRDVDPEWVYVAVVHAGLLWLEARTFLRISG